MNNLGEKLLQARIVSHADMDRVALQKKKVARRKRRDARKALFQKIGAALHIPSSEVEKELSKLSTEQLRVALQRAPMFLKTAEEQEAMRASIFNMALQSFIKSDTPEK